MESQTFFFFFRFEIFFSFAWRKWTCSVREISLVCACEAGSGGRGAAYDFAKLIRSGAGLGGSEQPLSSR